MSKVWDPGEQERPRNWRQLERKQSARRQEPARTPRPARVADPDACPAGYDPDVWSLTLLFHQLASAKGIQLVHGKPLTYSMLLPRIEAEHSGQ